MALTKLQYDAYLNGNVNILKDLWNIKYAQPFGKKLISNIDDLGDDMLISFVDGTFIQQNKSSMKWHILYLDKLDTSIEIGSHIRTRSLASSTVSLRRGSGVVCPRTYEGTIGILNEINVSDNLMVKVKILNDRIYSENIGHSLIEKHTLTDTSGYVSNIESLNNLISGGEEYDYEQLEKNISSVVDLGFVSDVLFEGGSILFKIREYDLGLGYGYKIHMPEIVIRYDPTSAICVGPRTGDYYHPHIGPNGNICLGTAQDAMNKNKFNFDLLLLTLYELLCTYNRHSPYFKVINTDFINFVISKGGYLDVDGEKIRTQQEIYDKIYYSPQSIY